MEEQHNKGKIESFMTELGRKLDQLLDKARQGAEEHKLSDRMDDLRQTKDKLERELHEFVQDDDKWREVQTHLQEAAVELRKAFETTFTRKKGNESDQQTTGESWNTGAASGSTNWNATTSSDPVYGSSAQNGSDDETEYGKPGSNPL